MRNGDANFIRGKSLGMTAGNIYQHKQTNKNYTQIYIFHNKKATLPSIVLENPKSNQQVDKIWYNEKTIISKGILKRSIEKEA
jgi:hypothetical protein